MQDLFSSKVLKILTETSLDGILAVNNDGKSILFNKRFGEMWNIPEKILNEKDDEKMLSYVLNQLKSPSDFLRKVKELYLDKDTKSRDRLEFKDGKVFDRYSVPLVDDDGDHCGRIWYFRNITNTKNS